MKNKKIIAKIENKTKKEKNRSKLDIIRSTIKIIILTLIISVFIHIAISEPEGPTQIKVINSTRKLPEPALTFNASAGNVTQINIIGKTITQTWQGYYGNITGIITLEDSAGNVLYNWTIANPRGEIYASTSQIDFSLGNIECYNYTKTGNGYLDLYSYEESLGLSPFDSDGIDETFVYGRNYTPFYAGVNFINQTCPETQLLNASGQKEAGVFQEILLYDLTSNKVIFTSIIEISGKKGFNNEVWDFQMLVAEKGRGDDLPTKYYFYVEIE